MKGDEVECHKMHSITSRRGVKRYVYILGYLLRRESYRPLETDRVTLDPLVFGSRNKVVRLE